MYADFEYYTTEYGGMVFGSAEDFKPYIKRAERRIDNVTSGKLTFAFPTEEKSVTAVKDCVCELAEFLYQVAVCQKEAMNELGTIANSDGTVRGKVIKSITSGSESISYGTSGDTKTVVSEAAKDRKVLDITTYSKLQTGLSGIADANGVNLLYAGPYPGEECVWE